MQISGESDLNQLCRGIRKLQEVVYGKERGKARQGGILGNPKISHRFYSSINRGVVLSLKGSVVCCFDLVDIIQDRQACTISVLGFVWWS